ncbi:unnamed protein product [Hymenolepis diminuta]|uniref:Uncharacterized protein n=1 Tax=Hymenolepis diminuta TaxID=6216 RepID=A0A564YCE5_HYMDI|nr:unnamed protein product [Hymenolepis diminuta]
MPTCNCSELSSFEHPALGSPLSSFRLRSSFSKSPVENHLLRVFSFTTSFP